jgi:hypothetical protein
MLLFMFRTAFSVRLIRVESFMQPGYLMQRPYHVPVPHQLLRNASQLIPAPRVYHHHSCIQTHSCCQLILDLSHSLMFFSTIFIIGFFRRFVLLALLCRNVETLSSQGMRQRCTGRHSWLCDIVSADSERYLALRIGLTKSLAEYTSKTWDIAVVMMGDTVPGTELLVSRTMRVKRSR